LRKKRDTLLMNQKLWVMTSTAISINKQREVSLLIPIAEMVSIRGSSVLNGEGT
jgi:hypothetical protein